MDTALKTGCQTALFSLVGNLNQEQIKQKLTDFGLFSTPSIGLLAETIFKSDLPYSTDYVVGNDRTSPLMIARHVH